ncbi:MAG: hypothetical protein F4Y34_08040 [Gammaproteobacteria bacterium]|nr:hypothetical protein [Gammaproteobacteria bacterium]MYH86606.1 hypothetical protein [Gammaproteobacteria bacterium]
MSPCSKTNSTRSSRYCRTSASTSAPATCSKIPSAKPPAPPRHCNLSKSSTRSATRPSPPPAGSGSPCRDRPTVVHRARANSGFTLIEVLLALGLTAALLGLLSSAVFVVASDWNRDSNVLDRNLDDSLAVLQLDRALHGAFPHSWMDEEELIRRVYFRGEDETLSWVSTVSPQRTPGLTAWQLFNDPELGVALKLAPAFSDNPDARLEQAEASLLLPGYQASFQYLYTELDESRQWTGEWYGDENLALPLAVYVLFEPIAGEGEPMEVVARIRNRQHRSIQPAAPQQGFPL